MAFRLTLDHQTPPRGNAGVGKALRSRRLKKKRPDPARGAGRGQGVKVPVRETQPQAVKPGKAGQTAAGWTRDEQKALMAKAREAACAVCSAKSGNAHDADDIAAEVAVRALQLPRHKIQYLGAWTNATAKNVAADLARKAKRARAREEVAAAEPDHRTAEVDPDKRRLGEALIAALQGPDVVPEASAAEVALTLAAHFDELLRGLRDPSTPRSPRLEDAIWIVAALRDELEGERIGTKALHRHAAHARACFAGPRRSRAPRTNELPALAEQLFLVAWRFQPRRDEPTPDANARLGDELAEHASLTWVGKKALAQQADLSGLAGSAVAAVSAAQVETAAQKMMARCGITKKEIASAGPDVRRTRIACLRRAQVRAILKAWGFPSRAADNTLTRLANFG